MRITIVLVSSMTINEVNGQNYSSHDKFYFIEFGQDKPLENSIQQTLDTSKSDLNLLFALKTNLLFDALTMINLEAEVPIKDCWSIAGEIIFPWWTMDNHRADSRRNRLQLLNGNLEGRYWWGDRATQPTLTGWFTGIYTGLATYDLEHHARGYQGDILFTIGATAGYAHPINRGGNLRMEYSLGVGYMTTYYHYYEAEFCDFNYWHAVEKRKGRYKWFGPTRVKISLSWLIDCNIKR